MTILVDDFRWPSLAAAARRDTASLLDGRGVERNALIRALPDEVHARLAPFLEPIALATGEEVDDGCSPPCYAIFPRTAVLAADADAGPWEIGAIGDEGVTAVSTFLGAPSPAPRTVVLVAGEALRIPAAVLLAAARDLEPLRRVLVRYAHVLVRSATRLAACHTTHSIDLRCARALLTTSDRAGSESLTLTHDRLASLLGVRREGVTLAAGRLQRARLIRYRRGRMTILDRDGLARAACACRAELDALRAELREPLATINHQPFVWDARPEDRFLPRADASGIAPGALGRALTRALSAFASARALTGRAHAIAALRASRATVRHRT